ncbi:erythromycin esterase family protein [Nocardiopsis rhodophaea]|uniref:Erythromycin esterase family protein n=1 Tax=Nocardiopsis rhodophaea TaxID=280238 RepID=A0ABN2STA5_9ACTN
MTTRPSIHDAGWAYSDDTSFQAALASFLDALPTRPRLLGLGEPMHGEEAFPQLRNRVFQYLVEHEGYRSIAIESDCVAGLMVDDYIAEGAGSLDDVMKRGFSHGFGKSAANRELVEWMRDYNQGQPGDDRLRFFGFDAPTEITGAPSPRLVLTALYDYLAPHVDIDRRPCTFDAIDALIGDDERWTHPDAMMDPSQSVGSSSDVAKLRLITDDLLALLTSESPHLVSATSPADWRLAHFHGRTAAGLLRYHATMADTSPARWQRLMSMRDAMMSDNLNAIAANQARQGPTLVFAHNLHLQRHRSDCQMGDQTLEWWSAGAIIDPRIGDHYAVIASALGSAQHHGVDTPGEDTVEGILCTLPEDHYVLDSRRLAAALDATESEPIRRPDQRTGDGYFFALDPDHLAETDGVIFTKNIASSSA